MHGFHCDLYGHVNNARYLEFLEAARWEAFGTSIDIDRWHAQGWLFVVVNIEIAYRAPSTIGDRLTVETWRGELGRANARIHQRVHRASDSKVVAEAVVTFVVLDRATQRPMPFQGDVLEGVKRIPAADPPSEPQ